MAKARVKMNSAGVREVLSSSGVRADLLRRGARVAAAMNATAPVGETSKLSQSHKAEADEHPNRVAVHIGSELDYALGVAVGTGYMARALDVAGGA